MLVNKKNIKNDFEHQAFGWRVRAASVSGAACASLRAPLCAGGGPFGRSAGLGLGLVLGSALGSEFLIYQCKG